LNRRSIRAGAIICALLAAGLFLGRELRHGLALKAGVHSAFPSPGDPSSTPAPVESAQPYSPSAKSPSVLATVEAAPLPKLAQATPAVPSIDPRKALGSKSAPITIEVFSDYQCPACRTLYVSVWRQLVDNYANTGKVYLVHRDFPLPVHAHSRVAAHYANAAAHIGKFEIVEQLLFEKQATWEQSGDVDGTVARVLTPAEMTKVRALVKGGTLEEGIKKDVELAQFYRVTQTPTSIITCKGQTYPVVGVQSYAVFHAFLDQLLSQK
jgi:protein-disulfide isomerase